MNRVVPCGADRATEALSFSRKCLFIFQTRRAAFLTWRGRTIEVNVKGQKYEDAINWELTPFTNLAGATVTLTRASDGAELASAVSDAGGDAVLTVPAVGLPTLCYIGVKGKYFTSGDLSGGIEQTASWTKPVIVIW